MQKLAAQNMAETVPAPWIETLFHSHPSIGKRVAAAETWAHEHSVAVQPLS
jgi:Zn-dependent protease with chaperone function